MAAYNAALAAVEPKGEKRRGYAGTIDRLVSDYFASPDFLRMKPGTRAAYRLVIERWVKQHNVGHRLVAQMTRDHVKRMMAKRADTPGAANDLMKKIRILMTFAIEAGLRSDNPAAKLKKFASGEHHTWTEEQIAAFEARWLIGTRERLAFALHSFTGQRTSDVRRMSWSDIDDEGLIQIVQQKTGAKIWVPLHPQLKSILAGTKREHLALLTTSFGQPFSTKGLGNFMAEKIGASGLPQACVTHGLRKAAARRFAEAGCSTKEIAAITGHQSLAEVERYTKSADQRRLANVGDGPCRRTRCEQKLPTRHQKSANPGKFRNEIRGLRKPWRALGESNPSLHRERVAS